MTWARPATSWLVRLEIPILALIYAYFVLTDSLPLLTVAAIVLIWAARWISAGRLTRTSPLDLPILLTFFALATSLWVSSNWWLSLPKIYGVVLSVAFYYAFLNNVSSRRDLAWASFWLVLVFAAIAVAGLIGTDWAQAKIVSAAFIYDRLPRFIQGIPRSIAGGFARNGVGGTLTLTIPFLLCVLLGSLGNKQAPDGLPSTGDSAFPRRYLSPIAAVALLLSLATLALTQSRGAILGTAVGLIGIAIWRERRAAFALAGAGAIVLVLLLLGWGSSLLNLVLALDASNGTLASRVEVWQRGIWMVQDFPLTGIGIGTYNNVAHLMYPFFIAAPNEVVAHAHNNLLQVAVDVGIPGLIAYTAILTISVLALVKAFRSTGDPRVRALAVGTGMGILAHQVFGLTDAFMLGTKPGVLLWIYSALAMVLGRWHELRA